MKIREEIGLEISVANTLSNIAEHYSTHGYPSKSLDYFYKSLKIYERLDYKYGEANSLIYIGKH